MKPDAEPSMRAHLEDKAAALKAKKTWNPSAADLQRGRAQMLKELNAPQNLPVAQFAKMANKSLQQVHKDMAAKRVLGLNVGRRGQRIPDWQLNTDCLELTQRVLAKAADVDEWTLFQALTEPIESLHGKTPVTAVHKSNMNKVLLVVLNRLGVQENPSSR